VNASETVVGWYSTGPKICSSDLDINEVFRNYVADPVLCVIDVHPNDEKKGLPTKAYISVQEPESVCDWERVGEKEREREGGIL
jgi:26S proteasome regulatory subunit N8